MSRRNRLNDLDPLARGLGNDDASAEKSTDDERSPLTMNEADAALFGELARVEKTRQPIKPISIFQVFPDVKQPRRAVPLEVRERWTGDPKDIADLFNIWLQAINEERTPADADPFDLDRLLWAEAVEQQGREQEAVEQEDAETYQPGPFEKAFLKVIELAISIRRDGLINPVTVQGNARTGRYIIETGERRWLAYHILYAYFNGFDGKPAERDKWENVPAIIVDELNVWRQASENAARADLNAVGRARQFSVLMMDLLAQDGVQFREFDNMIEPGKSDRAYYAQVVKHRVPKGKGELLLNGMGMSHRAAFTRCRNILSLPDPVWLIADKLDLSEDELQKLARLSEDQAIAEARKIEAIVASRNNSDKSTSDKSATPKPPPLFKDAACFRGKPLIPKENQQIARELFRLRSGVGQAEPGTKKQIRQHIEEMRAWLAELETSLE